MTALQTIAVAFAMFSALPMPQFAWNEKNMRYRSEEHTSGLRAASIWTATPTPAMPFPAMETPPKSWKF